MKTRLTDVLGIEHPVMLAGMGGVSYAPLVAAVSEAGGFGCFGASTMTGDEMVEQIRAQAEDARRAHAAEIEAMLADWDAANKRVQRYESDLLPLAHERAETALAGYRGGRGDLAPVLEARKAEIDSRMNQLNAQADLARAWANLNFLLPDTKDHK